MGKFLALITLAVLLGCMKQLAPMPKFETPAGEECALACQRDYSGCMALDIRPDFLLFSPRETACKKMLQECYQSCLSKEEKVSAGYK